MTSSNTENDIWNMVLDPSTHWWDLQFRDVWHYRDLLGMFVCRDFVAVYKQTILGPLWFFIQLLFPGIVMFKKVERSFMDTV